MSGPSLRPVIRVGIPQTSGHLVAEAHRAGLPVLFSANAFAKTSRRPRCIGPVMLPAGANFAGFNLSAARSLPASLDAALDSAGFVAANVYGEYRWGVSAFYDLVVSRNWAWHAAMDFCMEPQVAASKLIRRLRLNATQRGYFECVTEATRRGAPMPMPVLQGYAPDDYLHCMELLAIQDWPKLVGIGSVCRRHVHGPDGIASVVEALDKVLPPHVRFHLFGAKTGAILELGDHPRFGGVDSMAFDFAVRCHTRTGRTQAMRSDAMKHWHSQQSAIQPKPWQGGSHAFSLGSPPVQAVERIVENTVADWFAENVGDHGYQATKQLVHEQVSLLLFKLRNEGLSALSDSDDAVDLAVFDVLHGEDTPFVL